MTVVQATRHRVTTAINPTSPPMPTRPHRIHLAGPWEWLPNGHTEEGNCVIQTCQLPFAVSTIDGSKCSGTLRRKFHCPTGLSEKSSVMIVIECNSEASVSLNGQRLKAVTPSTINSGVDSATQRIDFDVSKLLTPFNELCVCLLPLTPNQTPSLASACLEICDAV